ncbi:ribosomal protein L21-like protein [Coniochaeta sp. 2T2.1]|nr:ribosomal protein L21-like protein [Coniochaeta sp. 2T2.1]
MSRSLLRSVLELRTPVTRLPPTFLLPIRARRCLHQTSQIIEPTTSTPASTTPESNIINAIKQQSQQTSSSFSSSPLPNNLPSAPSPPSHPLALDPSITTLLPLLAAQPGHYITIHIHGRPYLVTAGDQLRLPFKMPGVVPGDVLRLNRASTLGSRDFTLKGAPFVDERLFECRAVVLGTEAEPMRVMVKKKRRCRRSRSVFSKHKYTVLRIAEVKVGRVGEMEV